MLVRFLNRFGAVVLLATGLFGHAAFAADRHAGYYYPIKITNETYVARAQQLGGSTKLRRLSFVSGISNKLWLGKYAPPYAMFAKGSNSEKIIIVGMGGYVRSLFQARALLATLSAQSRTTKLFREFNFRGDLTFFDLAFMLGFKQLTISDGKTFSHQVRFVKAKSK